MVKKGGLGMAEKKCKYLNIMYGLGRYLCLWHLKPIGNDKPCETCKHNTGREKKDE